MKKYTVLVVDDERLAREELKLSLKDYADFELVGEAANADDAEKFIVERKPDVVFLDVQMPERSGLDLLESIDSIREVVFVTAFDAHAVKAFELGVLDYLVKPVRQERFAKTIEKLRTRLSQVAPIDKIQRLFTREGDRFYFIEFKEIIRLESSGNYVCIYTKARKHYLKRSLTQMENLLDPIDFFRINRNEIVNTTTISEVRKDDKGRIILILNTGDQLEVSSRQSTAFRNRRTNLL